MTVRVEPRSNTTQGWPVDADGWGEAVNVNFQGLSRLGFHPSVISNTITTPPAGASHGDRYLIPAIGATGAWLGHANSFAYYDTDHWEIYAPVKGMRFHVESTDDVWSYNGTKWRPDIWLGTQAQYDALPAADKAAGVGTTYYIRP